MNRMLLTNQPGQRVPDTAVTLHFHLAGFSFETIQRERAAMCDDGVFPVNESGGF
jgi:hypothetical protein